MKLSCITVSWRKPNYSDKCSRCWTRSLCTKEKVRAATLKICSVTSRVSLCFTKTIDLCRKTLARCSSATMARSFVWSPRISRSGLCCTCMLSKRPYLVPSMRRSRATRIFRTRSETSGWLTLRTRPWIRLVLFSEGKKSSHFNEYENYW